MNLRILLIIVFILNLVQGIFTPIIDDEAYYWLWSTKLDFGYFDHPPMIALWIALSDFIFNGEIGARFFTVLFNTITVYLFWKIVEPKTKKEIKLFTIIYFSLLLVQVFSFVSTPDASLLFFTVSYLYVLKNYIKNQSFRWTALLGICFAGLMYSKYHGVLVLAFTLLPILTFLIKKQSFYVAVLFSLLLYSPHLFWLYQNDFPPISYHFIDRSAEQKFSFTQPLIYILTAILSAAGLLFIYIGKALEGVNKSDLYQKSVFWLVVGPFLFFLISTIKDTTQAQWLLISYIGLGLLLYWYIRKQENTKQFEILGFTTIILMIVGRIIITIPYFSPFYETKTFGELSGELSHTKIVAFEKYQEASIFQFYNQDRQGVVYRTLGNRHSQFSLWDTENLLNQPFTYITPWKESMLSFEGLKKKQYYINIIDNYKPIHHTEALFLEIEDNELELKRNVPSRIKIQLNNIDIDLLKKEQVKLSLFITEDQQYYIVEEINVPMNNWTNPYEQNDGFVFEFNYQHSLTPGEYKAFIGVTPDGLIPKYQSKSLKIIVTE
ncbi:MAG: glycosyltransferase family 39 protein [Weeksellaceae bacterium]|nr:glycosyltransferase family 39 protein [Weeksellaceae bacterium]